MSDIFICYSRTEITVAKKLAGLLREEKEQWTVFLDIQTPVGRRWHQEIQEELHSAKAIVVLWSVKSTNSDFVLEEAEYGKRKLILFPAFIEEVEYPYGFGRIQTANLIDWKGDHDHAGVRKLIESLHLHLRIQENTLVRTDVLHAQSGNASEMNPRSPLFQSDIVQKNAPQFPKQATLTIIISAVIGIILMAVAAPLLFLSADPTSPSVLKPSENENIPVTSSIDESIFASAEFDFDKATLKPGGKQSLDELVAKVADHHYDRIIISGYTARFEGENAPEFNKTLSLRRAQAAKFYLVEERGIDASKIYTVGKGEDNPLTGDECQGNEVDKAWIACLQPDRRVEVQVVLARNSY